MIGAVFVDYDGTVTDRDTFDVLVRTYAGSNAWEELEERLRDGAITLRQALSAQASYVRASLVEADRLLIRETRIDPDFGPFVAAARRAGATVTIVSAGLGPLLERALARAALNAGPLRAHDADIDPNGWRMVFRDDSPSGHDKSIHVIAARERGQRVAYVGDGVSDYDAALCADERFAKAGRGLESFLRERGEPFRSFERFSEVQGALFPEG